MTMATTVMPGEDRRARWLLLISLGLNLFLVGAVGAFAVRYYVADRAASTAPVDRSVAARFERLAATLPGSDGDVLRGEYRAASASVESQRDAYRAAQDRVRQTLRSEPFQPEAMRAAMRETRGARQALDQVLQDILAAAAAKMTPAGRDKLADWPPAPGTGRGASR